MRLFVAQKENKVAAAFDSGLRPDSMTWRTHFALIFLRTVGGSFGKLFLPAFAGILSFAASSGHAQVPTPAIVGSSGITFTGLSGPNLAPYNGSVEGNFAVTPTSGSWYESTIYGSPSPSILVGPVNAPGPAVIQITDSAGRFTLSSFDFSSNNGNSLYDIQGFLGSTLAYNESGQLPGTFGPFNFSTLLTSDPGIPVDGLLISIIPQLGTPSVNLDNIEVATVPLVVVPEPGTYGLWGLALVGLIRLRTKTCK